MSRESEPRRRVRFLSLIEASHLFLVRGPCLPSAALADLLPPYYYTSMVVVVDKKKKRHNKQAQGGLLHSACQLIFKILILLPDGRG